MISMETRLVKAFLPKKVLYLFLSSKWLPICICHYIGVIKTSTITHFYRLSKSEKYGNPLTDANKRWQCSDVKEEAKIR